MTSVLNVDTIADKAGTGPVGLTKQIATKAWTNFNGSGTLAAEDSFNVASVTDNGTGNYTPFATNSMSNTGYAFNDFGWTRFFRWLNGAFIGQK